ncbi:hypothetical protein Tco_1156182 [Tanacetum coccineum]
MKDLVSNGGSRNYVPNDEWKLLEFERNNPICTKQNCIVEYELFIDDNDFDYMCDYLFSKDTPLFMNNMDEKLEERKCELVGTPREQIGVMEQEVDKQTRSNGYIEDTK